MRSLGPCANLSGFFYVMMPPGFHMAVYRATHGTRNLKCDCQPCLPKLKAGAVSSHAPADT